MTVSAKAETALPLRVCADPDNLPFSSKDAATPGVYVALGQQIAKDLGRPFQPVWWLSYFGQHTVKVTLLEHRCDAYIGLPDTHDFMGKALIFSKPLLTVGYVIALPHGQKISSLDELKGKRVAVQFGSSPQVILAENYPDITPVTLMSPEEEVHALSEGKVDAAFVWGPVAGYMNKNELNNSLTILPAVGHGMQFPVAIGYAADQTDLRDQIDHVLDGEDATLAALRAQYGFPVEPGAGPGESADVRDYVRVGVHPAPQSQESSRRGDAGGDPMIVKVGFAPAPASEAPQGREIFDGTCAHCHGPDANTSERRINLRLLHHRYGDKMDEVFHYTVTHGRPDKGMPNWTGVFSEDDFAKILAFLHTVQQNP